MHENKNSGKIKIINLNSIAIGSIITLFGIILVTYGPIGDFNSIPLFFGVLLLSPVIGGFAAAYINKPLYEVGVVNGTFAAVIGLIISQIFDFITSVVLDGIYDTFYIDDIMMFIIPIALLGFFGAFIGTTVKKFKYGKLFSN
ncbi:hypothetical protein [Methanobacterium sp. ACI-7]|uniref:hypothetical protein n=1 Tax=unclassified Methanobacterium TaxID=2627676 RepID=UPI0039C3A8BE